MAKLLSSWLPLAVVLAACSADTRGPSAEEEALFEDIEAYLDAQGRCDSDGDCQNVSTECLPRRYHQDCCVVYLHHDYDVAQLEALEARSAELGAGPAPDGSCGGCCLALPTTPACIDGRCQPAG